MKLTSILGKIGVGNWVITKKKFLIQWDQGPRKCVKGARIESYMRGPNEVARICDITFEPGREDAGTVGQYTVTCEFLYGGLNGRGCVGVANGATLEEIVSPGKPK
jgi:hypothetical protein